MALPRMEEATLYEPIIRYLREIGFDAVGSTVVTRKHPDILFRVGAATFVVEVKLGKPEKQSAAYAQAWDYARRLETDNIVVLVYPEEYRDEVITDGRILDKLALDGHVHALVLTDYWTDDVKDSPKRIFEQLKHMIVEKKRKIDFHFVVAQIEEYVRDLHSIIHRINTDELVTEVVDKLDLFCSVGQIKDKETARRQVVGLGAYLLFNQLLFYHIYKRKTNDPDLDELEPVDEVADLQHYFDEITHIDFRPIYRINILGHIPEKPAVVRILNEVIKSIKLLRAEHITHDLAGRFFHDLIPFEARKVLAAFYTHPVAAEILANLAIDTWDQRVVDPACGSGTLLVSTYTRKRELYAQEHGQKKAARIHRQFVEEDITGIDIMPFAAHIRTLNLTIQNIEQETNVVRIAARDSLGLADLLSKPAFKKTGTEFLPYAREVQERLFPTVDAKVVRSEGALSPDGKGKGFRLKPTDIVIMNPPFSDREKMPKDMRNKLKNNLILTEMCGNRVNLWGFFLVLADLMLKPEGKLACVVPINFGRGAATQKVRDYLLDNYRIKYIVKSVADLAFSEGAKFRDILLVAEKASPREDDLLAIVFLKKSIREMRLSEGAQVVARMEALPRKEGTSENAEFDIVFKSHNEIKQFKDNLMPILGAPDLPSLKAFTEFSRILKKRSGNKLRKLGSFTIKEGFHASPKGLSELTFVTRPTKGERTRKAFLLLGEEKTGHIRANVKGTDLWVKIPREKILPALRTLTNVDSYCIGEKCDYFITDNFKGFEKVLMLSKWKDKRKFGWGFVAKKASGKSTHLVVARRFRPNSESTHFFAFSSGQKFIAPHTFKIITASKSESTLQCLCLNSVVGLLGAVLYREQTTEGYADIMESDLVLFDTVNSEKLTEGELRMLNDLYEDLRTVEFPSIVRQLEGNFWARVRLDKAILKVLGLKEAEIIKHLPRIYDSLIRNLKQN